jgi:hypothetical protein
MRRDFAIMGAVLFLLAAAAAPAQDWVPFENRVIGVASVQPMLGGTPVPDDSGSPVALRAFNLAAPVPRVQMSPDLALATYLNGAQRQLAELGAYSDATVIEADLPATEQHGKYELRRMYQAPRSLVFAAIHFAGDSFVKTNIITKLLQSEVDHVQKGEGGQTAITADNYKFNLKGTDTLDGRTYYRYQVKPRRKRSGLFKGFILVDTASGRLRRAEGTMVKSPSLFVKKIEFVQDYADYGPFSLPVHVHSVAKTRLVGRAVVEIYHSGYQAKTVAETQSGAGSTAGSSGVGTN